MKIPKKKTNNFETTPLGIDLFIKWIVQQIKDKKNKKTDAKR